MNWELAYKVSVVALLALILAQLSDVVDLRHDVAFAVRRLSNIGKAEEAPAPSAPRRPGSFDWYEEETIQQLVEESKRASAPAADRPPAQR